MGVITLTGRTPVYMMDSHGRLMRKRDTYLREGDTVKITGIEDVTYHGETKQAATYDCPMYGTQWIPVENLPIHTAIA